MRDPRQCEDCGVFTSNENHACIEYDPAHPCAKCGAPSVFVYISGPGAGKGWSCKNGHYDGTNYELSISDVI